MIRSYLQSKLHQGVDFQPRGSGSDRMEALSDGVFSLAIALMVLSSSVPSNYQGLLDSMQNVFPFAIAITLIIRIWLQHVRFYYFYGIKDNFVLFLNVVMLFLILIYVYPLKFLFNVLTKIGMTLIFQVGEPIGDIMSNTLSGSDGTGLMAIFGIGGFLIYGIYALLYHHAYRFKSDLKLTVKEQFITKTEYYRNLIKSLVPLLSAAFAYFHIAGSWSFPASGMIYLLLIVLSSVLKRIRAKAWSKIIE